MARPQVCIAPECHLLLRPARPYEFMCLWLQFVLHPTTDRRMVKQLRPDSKLFAAWQHNAYVLALSSFVFWKSARLNNIQSTAFQPQSVGRSSILLAPHLPVIE